MGYFEILLSGSVILCCVIAIRLYRIRKHDKVLYRFCQVRRDIMAYLRTRGFEMSKHDYFAVRDLLEVVSSTIHHFNACKATVFNFRTLNKMAREFRETGRVVEEIRLPKDPAAVEIFDAYRKAMIGAFLTYTPFMRSEILLRLILAALIAISSFAARLGCRSWETTPEDLAWVQGQLRHQHA